MSDDDKSIYDEEQQKKPLVAANSHARSIYYA